MQSNSALFDIFLFETKKSRESFIEILEEKYVKNQDLCDVICIQTLQIVKDKGHLKKIKEPLEFGTTSTYKCKPGRKVMKILRKRIRIKKRISAFECDVSAHDCSKTESSGSYDTKPCVVKLTKLNFNENGKCTSEIKELQKQKFFIDPLYFRNQLKCVSNETASFKNVSLTTNNKFSAMCQNNISICDLSFRQLQFFDKDIHKNKSFESFHNHISARNNNKKDMNKPKSRNLYMELEKEVEIIDEYCSYDSYNSTVSKKSNHLYNFNFASKLRNFNFTETSVVEKDSAYNRYLHSKNMVASKIKPLPTPKIFPNCRLKRCIPTYFETLLKEI